MISAITAKLKFSSGKHLRQKWPLIPPGVGFFFKFGGAHYESRVVLDAPVSEGDEKILQIVFLNPGLVIPKLHIGDKFQLVTREIIAEGVVEEIGSKDESLNWAIFDRKQDKI